MSMIYDALEKAQKDLSGKDSNKKNRPPSIVRAAYKRQRFDYKVYLIIILFLTLFSSLFVIYFTRSNMAKERPENTDSNVRLLSNKPRVSILPDLNLNGIVVDVSGRLAVINDVILTRGESILGAVVDTIHHDKVDLDYEGEKITLYLK